MKKTIVILSILIVICATSLSTYAENWSTYSTEDLQKIRDEINSEIGSRIKAEELAPNSEALGRIKDIFPDEALAMVVRDSVAKFSIEQTVTQAELDEVKYIQLFSCEHGNFSDLTGIGYLRNLKQFSLYNNMEYLGTSFPEEFYTLTQLETIEVVGSKLSELSPSLGNLTNLKTLEIGSTDVSILPESIGNLQNLKTLDIGYTNITALPVSIWNLKLDSLDMAGLPIK